ncbi:MAG TPA: RnfABCDGE type electron transport complex subunit D [Xanthomonadaceae bacterium]|nr:RnfABCDGE type electron transport complex subunit D [Xanthomonadaceae bacterium]
MRQFETAAAPHLPAARSVRAVMGLVLLALVPGVAAHGYWFGPGILIQIALAMSFALAFEAAMLRLRRRPLAPYLGDLSAPVTAVLFALCVPPLAPWWVAAVAMLTAMVFAKHLYGGLGSNLFNPAMAAYAVVLICFPFELSQWLPPRGPEGTAVDLVEAWRAVLTGAAPGPGWDALAQATPLDRLRTLGPEMRTLGEIRADPLFGAFGGRGWEWIAVCYVLGGALLLYTRVIHWQVPVATIGTVIALSLPWFLADPDLHPSPLVHLFSGALVLAAFFVATDPVTGCATPRGRLIFGAGVAAITLVIRCWGAYPDGVAFAVLLMNCAAPWIDLHTRPRIFGERPT